MATHRSLNKLEFKAHMSIHQFKDFTDAQMHNQGVFTRDRFGKKHSLSGADGRSRLKRFRGKNSTAVAVLFFLSSVSWASAAQDFQTPKKNLKIGPNVTVSSTDPEIESFSDRMNRDERERFGIPIDTSTKLGFNDDGDAAVSNRF